MTKRRFAVLTSGGDAPGMNAAIRAVVRTGLHFGYEVLGVKEGFKGLLTSAFQPLSARDGGGIIQQGGTDVSIGVDTALNVALEAIDRIKVTASSHHRAFLVEVMGRNCSYLALAAGIAGGAEAIVMPENEMDPETLAQLFRTAYERGKAHAIGVIAEGVVFNAHKLASYFKTHEERLGFDLRVITLGHVQRGGAPGAFDRLLATRFGVMATECLHQDVRGVLVGRQKGQVVCTPYALVAGKVKGIDHSLVRMVDLLAD